MAEPSSELRVRPHPTVEYRFKQSSFAHLPKVPLRGILCGPSGQGKTVCLVDMILRLYKGCFERIYVFSPSIHIDATWRPVKDYLEQRVDLKKEPCLFDSWDEEVVGSLVKQQFKIADLAKNKFKMKRIPGVLFIVDDFADSPKVVHTSKGGPDGGSWLTSLFIRGRHACISTLCSCQYTRLLGPAIRTQATFWLIWRLRNAKDLFDSLLYELSAIYPVKTLHAMYELATSERFGFLFVNLQPKSGRKEDMFWKNFEARLIPRQLSIKDGTVPEPRGKHARAPGSRPGLQGRS